VRTLSRAAVLGGLAVLALSTTCAADPFGEINGIDFTDVLRSGAIQTAMAAGIETGKSIVKCIVPLWLIVCWARAMKGESWLNYASGGVIGLMVCSWVLTTSDAATFAKRDGACDLPAASIQGLVYQSGQCMASMYGQGSQTPDEHDALVKDLGRVAAQMLAGPAATPAMAGANVYLGNGLTVGLVVANALALDVIRLTMQVSFVFLIVFYSAMAPIVAPFVILSQTRDVFLGWLRSFISVALWPFFMGLLEVVRRGIPWESWAKVAVHASSGITDSAAYWMRGQFLLVIANFTFFALYLTIPIISSRIVNGANTAIKAGIF
jgi:hypothetical protein